MHSSGIGLQNSIWTNTRAALFPQVNCFWQYNHKSPLPWITKQSWFSTLSLQIPFLLSSVRDLLFTALHAWCWYCMSLSEYLPLCIALGVQICGSLFTTVRSEAFSQIHCTRMKGSHSSSRNIYFMHENVNGVYTLVFVQGSRVASHGKHFCGH